MPDPKKPPSVVRKSVVPCLRMLCSAAELHPCQAGISRACLSSEAGSQCFRMRACSIGLTPSSKNGLANTSGESAMRCSVVSMAASKASISPRFRTASIVVIFLLVIAVPLGPPLSNSAVMRRSKEADTGHRFTSEDSSALTYLPCSLHLISGVRLAIGHQA